MELRSDVFCRIRPTAPGTGLAGPTAAMPRPGSIQGHSSALMVGAYLDAGMQSAADPKFWNRVGPPAGRSPV